MTTAILAIVTVAALIWMLRVEARLREIFNRLDRQQAPGLSDTVRDGLEIF
ncbi:hypothetical protein [Xanthobacter variabilis]|uniref:hypothetical protein n=1 Tax=Xanthobacter variabilis TaxID=3119932 RepID=UPI0037274BC6